MEILDYLKSLHQDAIIWKTGQIWQRALYPDAEVEAAEAIVLVLACIPSEQKRLSYLERICKAIGDGVSDYEHQIKVVDERWRFNDKQLRDLQRKKKPNDDDQARIKELDHQKVEDGKLLGKLRSSLLPRLQSPQVAKMLKDLLDKRERQKAKKSMDREEQERQISAESLGLPSDFDGNVMEAHKYGIAMWKGRIFARDGKGNYEEVSDFSMRIIYFVPAGSDAAYRLIELKNIYNQSRVIRINTDDLVSVGSFKKIIARHGVYNFNGSDAQLSRLTQYLQQTEKQTDLVKVLGYHAHGQFYAFANGLIDTKQGGDAEGEAPEAPHVFHQVDEYGIVSLRDKNYFIPAMSKMFEDDDGAFANDKLFVYVENRTFNFEMWSKLHRDVYGNDGVICQLWFLTALFRDIIWGRKDVRSTPILFLYGQRGAGKTQCAESMMSLFGYTQPTIPLGSHSTPKGLARRFAQLRNAVVWVDEYKNNIKKDFIEFLKNVYDGSSYTRAVKTMDFQTESMPISSACMVSGQEMPTIEPALFTRVILLQFLPGKDRTSESKARFKKLKDLEAGALSCISAEALKLRPLVQEKFVESLERKKKSLFKAAGNSSIDDRFIMNIAILSSMREVLDGQLPFSFSAEDADTILVDNMKAQFEVMDRNDDLGKWWAIVEALAMQRIIRNRQQFRVEDGRLYIKVREIFGFYEKELRARGDDQRLPQSTLSNYLETDKEAFVEKCKQRFEGNSNSQWCEAFNYDVLQRRYNLDMDGYDNNHNDAGPIGFQMKPRIVGNWTDFDKDDKDSAATEQSGTEGDELPF